MSARCCVGILGWPGEVLEPIADSAGACGRLLSVGLCVRAHVLNRERAIGRILLPCGFGNCA